MNKLILTQLKGRVHILGIVQMSMTAILGAAKIYLPIIVARFLQTSDRTTTAVLLRSSLSPPASNVVETLKPLGIFNPSPASTLFKHSKKYKSFWRDMLFVGAMRGMTVLLGLVSLSHVAVSFTETIKASAPLFTVIFARVILGEITSLTVILSLFPVMLGLVLCSATELSFDMIGFVAAVSNNCIDCVQNVFSKRLLSGPAQLSPIELQFYTSVAAATMQLPVMLVLASSEIWSASSLEPSVVSLLLLDGLCYHMQSVTAYYTMSLISPVSQSVANTFKRSLLIVLSIWYVLAYFFHFFPFFFSFTIISLLYLVNLLYLLGTDFIENNIVFFYVFFFFLPRYFGNVVTMWSSIGMMTVVFGVVCYNVARQWQQEQDKLREEMVSSAASVHVARKDKQKGSEMAECYSERRSGERRGGVMAV